jgi:hypothetical protein
MSLRMQTEECSPMRSLAISVVSVFKPAKLATEQGLNGI